jgi:hypothetical protein
MLENVTFYQSNQESLRSMYAGRYLLIIEQKVLGDFCSWAEACRRGLSLLQKDTFLVKYCA